MRTQPREIFVDNDTKLTLHGLKQYYVRLTEEEKNRKLSDLLDTLEFNQVVIFVSKVRRATELARLLEECNFPTICIHSALPQEERIARFKAFKEFKKRILVSTDLFGRGIDIERVNIVINYDFPSDNDQYLHRVGRAGRFGTKGLAVSFISTPEDEAEMAKVQERFAVQMPEIPETIATTDYSKFLRPAACYACAPVLTVVVVQCKHILRRRAALRCTPAAPTPTHSCITPRCNIRDNARSASSLRRVNSVKCDAVTSVKRKR